MALYPPIVASSMPAFEVGEDGKGSVKIYFTLSTYNAIQINNIRSVQVTVRNQASNVNVLIGTRYPDILRCNIDDRTEEDILLNRYSVTLSSNYIKNSAFKPDSFYKVQLRFSSQSLNESESNLNLDSCSLWSTVCIIKPILAPVFHINEFKGFETTLVSGNLTTTQEKADLIYTYPFADFSAMYKQDKSSLSLKEWRLRLLDNSYTKEDYLNIEQYTEADSEWQFSSAYNYISNLDIIYLKCSLPYQFSNDKSYKLLFEIKTRNDYIGSKLYEFLYLNIDINPLSGEITTFINNELGYIKVNYNRGTLNGNIVLRRTDSKSNFLKWEDLKVFQAQNMSLYTYYDFTALSGMAYKYSLQSIDPMGRRGRPLTEKQKVTIADWDYAYLLLSTGDGALDGVKQLKLKYDFQISSLKTNTLESKTDTIGSKYPYIRRNGNMYYKSFSCTGTITSYMDNVDLFTSKSILYDNNSSLYDEANNEIENFEKPNNYNYIYLRKFRNAVELFLYNSKPKLYKSTQEGNMFIKLMEVSLTPKNLLGRLIYAFSATAYLIDLYSIDNLNKYNFITIGNYLRDISYEEPRIGQITSYSLDGNIKGNIFLKDEDIIGKNSNSTNSIAKRLKYNQSFNGWIVKDFRITYLRMTIDSLPYLIIETLNGLLPYENLVISTDTKAFGSIEEKLYQIESRYDNINNSNDDFNIYLGHLFYLSEDHKNAFIVSYPNNIYEIKDLNLLLNPDNFQIIPAKNTIMNVDYIVILNKEQDNSTVATKIKTEMRVGQIIGTYTQSTLIINLINYKYSMLYGSDLLHQERIFQYGNGVFGITIDTLPNTVINVRTNAFDIQDGSQRFVVNETGLLDFDFYTAEYNNVKITSFKIMGLNIDARKIIDQGTVTELPDVANQKELYTYNNNKYIYYRDKFYRATAVYDMVNQQTILSYDINCPVDAMIFYTVRVRSDYY